MAIIERLRIQALRNLRSVDLSLPPGLVWFVGGNGAGKTTLLEACYLLSRRRSFRGRRYGPLVARGEARCSIEGRIREGEDSWRRRWEWPSGQARDGQGPAFEVRLVGASMQALLEGEPALRRRFIDWNLFHVEPGFAQVRARFQRVAAQRNAWLQTGARSRPIWDEDYAALLSTVARMRNKLMQAVAAEFQSVSCSQGLADGLRVEFGDGLPAGEDIRAWLAGHRDAEVRLGRSALTPGRADFRFCVGPRPWVGSRGENKRVGVVLQVAAERVVSRQLGRRAVWLVDDLAAELSDNTRAELLGLLLQESDQLLFTSLVPPDRWALPETVAPSVFHVEHAGVAPAST